jgi:hypothetical protein
VDLVSPLAASTNSTTAYGDDGNGVSAAEAAVAIKGAKDGNIGIDLGDSAENNLDLDLITETGWKYVTNPVNAATSASGIVNTLYSTVSTDRTAQFFFPLSGDLGNLYFRSRSAGVVTAWQELYHTGNTGFLSFAPVNTSPTGQYRFSLDVATNRLVSETIDTIQSSHSLFINPNGIVGSIQTTGTATAYNTSSDPRLKDFKAAPTDEMINTEFGKLLDCFAVFNWKADPNGALVWGFDAHKAIDNGCGIGSDGQGPRDLPLGEEYQAAVTEEKPVLDSDGNPVLDEQGKPTVEVVEIEPAKTVTPAGVDQAKAVPVLIAKIEQLEKRIKLLEGGK